MSGTGFGSEAEIHRSLGNIEGTNKQILLEQQRVLNALEALGKNFADHVQADQIAFSSVRNLSYSMRDELKEQFEVHARLRDEHLNNQDEKLNALMTAKAVLTGQLTMGQKIVAYVGAFALFVIAVFEAYKQLRS